jgi:signal transduction histidine kinase
MGAAKLDAKNCHLADFSPPAAVFSSLGTSEPGKDPTTPARCIGNNPFAAWYDEIGGCRVRWPIRYQIFVPFATLVLVAVASIAVTTALLAARRSADERIDQLHRVESTLADAGFPFTESVLRKMQGLSGAQFVTLDDAGQIVTSTFDRPLERADLPGHLPASGPPKRLEQFEAVTFAGSEYYAAVLPGKESSGIASLLILYPRENLRRAQWEAAWPPLAVGIATICLMLAISAWLSGRLARRIESVRALFGHIADGQFAHVEAQRPLDEVYDLVLSANRLSDQLAAMRDRITRTERLRLLAQLAGGLAHQLRNAATGARMAIQLHQRRCPSSHHDESLDVALRQLVLTEEYVRGLLSLGQQESQPPSMSRLSIVVAEIERLVLPAARHAHVGWTCGPIPPDLDCTVDNSQNVRAGLLNVVLNAVEAAGRDGRVRCWVDRAERHVRVHVADSGSGPPESVQGTLFDPFVTSKPEGVGLGLALAKTVAAEQGGEVSWTRIGKETVFTMSLLTANGPIDGSRDSAPIVASAARESETETNVDPDCCIARGLP